MINESALTFSSRLDCITPKQKKFFEYTCWTYFHCCSEYGAKYIHTYNQNM